MSHAVTLNWDEAPVSEPLPGITRQSISGDRQTMVRYVYAPGSVFPVHSHPEEQITVVLSGRIVFTVDGARHDLGPGDVAVLPGGLAHGATVEGDETVVTINTLSPRRAVDPLAGS